jgi:hypothetical protein
MAGLRWDIFGGRNERSNRLEYFVEHKARVAKIDFTALQII